MNTQNTQENSYATQNKTSRLRLVLAAAGMCALLVGGSLTANAATGGELFQNIGLWANGEQVEDVQMVQNADGTYTVNLEDGTQMVISSDEELTGDVGIEMQMDEAFVGERDGRVYLTVGEEEQDVTEQLDENGNGQVELAPGIVGNITKQDGEYVLDVAAAEGTEGVVVVTTTQVQ